MISYFTKMYQAVPSLMPLYLTSGGSFVCSRGNTMRAIKRVYPYVNVAKYSNKFTRFSRGHNLMQYSSLIVNGAPNKGLLSQYAAKKMMLFHGTYAYLTPPYVADLNHFDYLCSFGPRLKRILDLSQYTGQVINSGYIPFLDFAKKSKEHKQQYLQKLGLNPNHLNLVYTPSGQPFSSFDLMAEKLVKEVPATFNLIIRPHPSQSIKFRLKEYAIFARLRHHMRQRGNAFLDLGGLKLSELLSVADLMLSDGNSPAEESLFYDVPQLVIETKKFSRETIRQIMFERGASDEDVALSSTFFTTGPIITPSTHDLTNRIEQALNDANHYKTQRDAHFAFVFGERGLSKQTLFSQSLLQFN